MHHPRSVRAAAAPRPGPAPRPRSQAQIPRGSEPVRDQGRGWTSAGRGEPPDGRPPPAVLRVPHRHPPPPRGDPPLRLQPNRRGHLVVPMHPKPALWHGPELTPRLRHRHPTGRRGRRHLGVRLRHAQPLRVGCVLGTCQVQNLSHRLWQLMGRPGRQDSSPMNPNSPHSYG
uniref:Adrenomedullin 2 n=1 Tax=Gallus gallus TaxID=9031 RepID=A0A8V0XY69_CHICK